MQNNEIVKSSLEVNGDKIRRNYLSPLRTDFMESHIYNEESRYRPDGPYQRDYARIMYSSSFRRLQGKMQLLGIKKDQFFRNRLTHSLEVAQIARSIAGTLKYDNSEIYVVEAGALAHDLGNPPFGHAGEKYLNKMFLDFGGFEGNAQTLRILMDIEKKRPNFGGLNLTYRTLFSVIKYFKKFNKESFINGEAKQKFIYNDDYNLLYEVIQENEAKIRTLDVQIVDLADEIAYAAHDLEDGLRIKAYTIDEILHDYKAEYGNSDCFNILKEAVSNSRESAVFEATPITDSTQYSKLFRQELSSTIINLALNDIGLVNVSSEFRNKTGTQQEEELGFLNFGELIHGLKTIVFKCINHNDEVYHYEKEGEKVIEFLSDLYRNDTKYLPPEYRAEELLKQYPDLKGRDKESLQERLICDYVSGMMDSYAITTYEKFSGNRFFG